MVKKKKKKKRIWLKAFLYALLILALLKTFIADLSIISGVSMNSTLHQGDVVFINKFTIGARMPITLISLPFFPDKIPFTNCRSWLEGIQLPYYRIPGLRKLKNDDVIQFNSPAVQNKPVDKRIRMVKRIVACPGDTFEIKQGDVFINRTQYPENPYVHHQWNVTVIGYNWKDWYVRFGIREGGPFNGTDTCVFSLNKKQLSDLLKAYPNLPVKRRIEPMGQVDSLIWGVCVGKKWNSDWMGPIVIPYKGMKIATNHSDFLLYLPLIRNENKNIETTNGEFYLNGKRISEYVFRMNYYFVLGDNRSNSVDSRYFGPVSEEHITGLVKRICSLDKK